MAQQGNFFVIEGTDGSGKGTQFRLLTERLQKAGYDVATFDFPRYEENSSYFVREYLNGKYGSADEVGPYTGSLFFSLDRYEASAAIRQALAAGKIVLANRFTGSNMAHQGTKFANIEQRRGYFIWLDNLEFQMLQIPRPDLNIVLRVPAEIAQSLVDKKEQRSYTDKKRDIHEADLGHMQRSVEVYDDLCNLFPKDFSQIDCVRSDKLLSIEAVHNLLWEKLQPLLPQVNKRPSQPVLQPSQDPTTTESPYVQRLPSGTIITKAGHDFLSQALTTNEGKVHGFTDKLSPITVATAMSQLSHGSGDIRTIILEEFANAADKDEKLMRHSATADDVPSVMELVGQHFVIENVSKLVTSTLERGAQIPYIEQSERHIHYDERDEHGSYRYYVPPHFDANIKNLYCDIMDQIFEKYSQIVKTLVAHITANSKALQIEDGTDWEDIVHTQATDAARAVLPSATTTTVGLYASGTPLQTMIMHLLSEGLPEAQTIGAQLLTTVRQLVPGFLEHTGQSEFDDAITNRNATNKAVQGLAKSLLPEGYDSANNRQRVALADVWPRNELDLVPDMLYEHADQPLAGIRQEVAQWPYDKKLSVFETYVGEHYKPGGALEKARYTWDLFCEFAVACDLQRNHMICDLQLQQLSPRYGYEIPALIEDAGLTDVFEGCFDLSLQLYSRLQGEGYQEEAQYAALLGHRVRATLTHNAAQTLPAQEPNNSNKYHQSYLQLVREMHEKLAEKHPLLADALHLVDKG
ncbi:hypothetical protein BH09PAT4_BH09PAT4_05730 [soil metagenome]